MKAVLWDNDGVLVDTERLYFETTRDALRELGIELSEEKFVELSLCSGGSCFDLARERGIDPARVEAVREARNDAYAERLDGLELCAGVREALAALHGRVRMAVVTSSRPQHFARQHARTGVLELFEFVLTGADFTRFKPDPQPYLMAAARLGLDSADCLVVEDSERGLEAAMRAGMRCAVTPRGLSARGDFSRAHRVLADAHELPALVAELAGW